MKVFRYGILVIILAVSVVACSQASKSAETASKEIATANLETTEFNIDGMMSPTGCAATIQKSLSGLKGVSSAKVDFENKKALVSFDSSKLTLEDIATTVTTIGDGHIYKVYNMAKVAADKSGANNTKETHDCSAACKSTCTSEMKANCTPEMEANCPMKKKV